MSMAKSRRKIDGQMSIFDLLASFQSPPEPHPGGLNVKYEFQGIICDAIKHCRHSRWEIAGRMSIGVCMAQEGNEAGNR
jgi:hypothetical protein